ncbi:MAG: hypothetical protein CMM29_09830 [Rhodospirillaceae bacterium]|nr:hypothetical protein [Rhodospirillaceae bacterium]|tara:strand:+ start:697 stop:1137 length:441 start_codon:yes stop_codon:yes gene_type:complete
MKITSCLIGFTLLFASLYLSLQKKNTQIFNKFYTLLDENQKNIYEKIVKERMMIYFSGMVLGLGLGIYFYIKNPKTDYKLCKFLAIIYVIKLGFYYLYPKSPLMLYSLTTKEQVSAWADIYTEMKERWIKSLVIGFIGYLFISLNF